MKRKNILSELAASACSGDGVVGGDAAGVVVAAGAGGGEAVAAAGGLGEGARGGAAADGAVGGGDVVCVAVHPEEPAADVEDEVEEGGRCALADSGNVLEGGGVFSDRGDEGARALGGGGEGEKREEREEEERDELRERGERFGNKKRRKFQ